MEKNRLSNDDFFLRLAELFDSRRDENKGSVFLTQKRLPPPAAPKTPGASGHADDLSDLNLAKPVPILVRATNGKWKEERRDRIKIATVVKPDDLDAFFTKYAEVCKSGMSGLKKRDRSGAKAKAKAKAKKRKEAEGEKK